MADETILQSLLQQLQTTEDPAARAAIVAEMAFDQLPDAVAQVARRAVILHWFDEPIVAALLPHDADTTAAAAVAQLGALPFVEELPWGYTYHEQTREGLLARYGEQQPAVLQEAAALAAPAYAAHANEELAGVEALYCLVASGQTEVGGEWLDALLVRVGQQADWQGILAIFQTVEAAEELPFAPTLPRSDLHYFARGLAKHELSDLAAAIADYDRAIQLFPDGPDKATAYYNRGIAHRQNGELEDAVADYETAIQLNPNDPMVYSNMSIALRMLGRWHRVLEVCKKAVELDPAQATSWVALAHAARRIGEDEQWRDAIQQARNRISGHDDYEMACLESVADNVDAALDLLRRAKEAGDLDVEWAKQDPDLHWIRDDPRFWEIVEESPDLPETKPLD